MILWWAVLAIAGVAATVWLAGSALAAWREQRAGLVYELTPRYRGAAVRGVAAVTVVGSLLAGGAWVGLGSGPGSGPGQTHPHAPAALAVDAAAPAATAVAPTAPATPVVPATTPAAPATPPSAAPAVPVPAVPAAAGLVTVGHPSGGELLAGALPGLPGRYRVWLPPQYQGRSAPLQALLVLADDAQLDQVFQGLSDAVGMGRSNPFVAVVPDAGCAPSGSLSSGPDAAALRRAVAARFHVQSDARGWALLGLGSGAPCAVTAELDGTGAYPAAAALSGDYGALPAVPTMAQPSVQPGTVVRLLLATARRDTAGQASAARLSTALGRLPHTDVRLSAVVRDFTPELERFRLVRLAAGYLTEQLAAPRP